MKQQGSSYLEAVISIGIVAILSTYFLPVFPKVVQDTQSIILYSKLNTIAEYVGNYMFRWAHFTDKQVALDFYSDGDEFEISGEKRVNRLRWASELNHSQSISDFYKTSITLWETEDREDHSGKTISAVVKIIVWYDSDLDNTIDLNEATFSFSTTIVDPYL